MSNTEDDNSNLEIIREVNESSKEKKASKNKLVETLETVVVALVLAIFIRATVAEARYIPSESMVPTLIVKDRLVVEKLSSYTGIPKRGEIIVFYPPFKDNNMSEEFLPKTLRWLGFTQNVAYIKRVVGLPGETIEVRDGQVYIDDKAIDESSYIKEKPFYDYGPLKLKDDELFMMGDNRNNSMDSHVWGPLPVKNIIGHAVLRFWPLNRISTLD